MNEDYSQLSNEALRRAYVAAKERDQQHYAKYRTAIKERDELETALGQAQLRVSRLYQATALEPESAQIMKEIQARLDDGRITGFA